MKIRIDNFAGFAVFSLEYVLRSLIAFAVERGKPECSRMEASFRTTPQTL